MSSTPKLSPAQYRLLVHLREQAEAARRNPLMYEREALVGTGRTRGPTANVLVRLGLVDERVSRAGVRTIALNVAGLAAL